MTESPDTLTKPSASAGAVQIPEAAGRSTRAARPAQLWTLLSLLFLPWCTLGLFLMVNPRYEMQLFASGMPGTPLLVAALTFTLLVAAATYASLGLASSLAERHGWSQATRLLPFILVGLAVTLLCTLPTFLLVTLGPAFVALTRMNAP